MIDANAVFAGLGGAAMVQSLVLLLARRWLGRVDTMEADIRELRDKEIGMIKGQIQTAAISRQNIHEKIAEIERDMVSREDLAEIQRNHVSHVRALAEVVTRIEHLNKHLDDQMQRMASVTADVNRIIGKMGD